MSRGGDRGGGGDGTVGLMEAAVGVALAALVRAVPPGKAGGGPAARMAAAASMFLWVGKPLAASAAALAALWRAMALWVGKREGVVALWAAAVAEPLETAWESRSESESWPGSCLHSWMPRWRCS